jgi:glycosyltransferase involved in cell wall biosynthesis
MRIAIDARKIDSPLTGIGRYTKNLLTHLAEIDKENEYIILQRKVASIKTVDASNFRIVVFDYPAFSLHSIFFLHKILDRERVEIFHSPFVSVPLFTKCRIVLTVHDLIPLKFAKSYDTRRIFSEILRKLQFRLILLISTRKAHKIITVSDATKKLLQGLDRALAKKIRIIYEAPEETFKRIPEEEIRKTRAKYRVDGNLLCYIGVIRPHKNLVMLFRALKLLHEEEKHCCYLAIGGGEDGNLIFLKKLAEKLNISRHVIFCGSLNDTEVVELMNAADVFVFPSIEEGFGLPPLEAMACETPVVCSNTSSLPEVVGDAALLVDPLNTLAMADAIRRLLFDQGLKKEMIKRGTERVRLFSWEKTARETLIVYTQWTLINSDV